LSHLVLELQFLNVLCALVVFGLLLFAVYFNVKEEVKERFFFDLFSLLFTSLLLVFLFDDFDGDVFALLPGDLVPRTLLDDLALELELFVELGIGKPLVFGEVEVNPDLLEVFGLSCLNS
jgi:hypothetical protein